MTWQREEIIGDARLLLGDCRKILPALSGIDAIVVDPPYGIGIGKRPTVGGGGRISGGRKTPAKTYGVSEWDDKPLEPATIALFQRTSRWQIIFGGNYYALPPSPCWLVWDKENTGNFADCELAWTNMPGAVRRLRYMWNGCFRKERDEPRLHPTQKPVGVMEWCIGHLPADALTICDPCMGSGTTGVACARLGRRFLGIESDPAYFEVARRRIDEAQSRGRLVFDAPAPTEQVGLGFDP